MKRSLSVACTVAAVLSAAPVFAQSGPTITSPVDLAPYITAFATALGTAVVAILTWKFGVKLFNRLLSFITGKGLKA